MTKIQKFSISFLQVLFAIMCLVVFLHTLQPDTIYEKAKKEQKIHEKNVRVACIVGIKKRLKNPNSMGIISRAVLNVEKNKWIAEIRIRAKNNFNTMVPLNFICDVCLDNEEYRLKRIRRN